MDNHQGGGANLERPSQNGARVQDDGSHRSAGCLFIAQEVVPSVQIKNVQALNRMVREPTCR